MASSTESAALKGLRKCVNPLPSNQWPILPKPSCFTYDHKLNSTIGNIAAAMTLRLATRSSVVATQLSQYLATRIYILHVRAICLYPVPQQDG